MTNKAQREIDHGKMLAQSGAENIWGWNNPAGKERAIRRAQLITNGVNLKSGMRVLEIGCGTGNFTEIFAESQAHITAVDISPDLIELARKRRLPKNQVQFVLARFEDIVPNTPYDAIIGSSVLHHLDIHVALQNIYHLLKPNGIMSFAEPNMMNPQIALQKNIPWLKKKMGDSPDETAFLRWKLKKNLIEKGFTNIHIRPFDFLHPIVPARLISTVKVAGKFLENLPVFREIAGSLYIYAEKPS